MNNTELRDFMNRHHLNSKIFSSIVGVTPSAVDHWLSGKRNISLTISRLCKTFDRYPQLLKEFHS